jgi:hypothetical protein
MRPLEQLRTGWQGTYVGIGKSVSTTPLPYQAVMRLTVNDGTLFVSRTLYHSANGAVETAELGFRRFQDRLTNINSEPDGKLTGVGSIGESLISYDIDDRGDRFVLRLVRGEGGRIFVRREIHPLGGESMLCYETLKRRELH